MKINRGPNILNADPTRPLPDKRWERFAQARAAGLGPGPASVEAGFALGPKGHVSHAVCTMASRPVVMARIAELMRPGAERVTLEISQLFEAILEQATFDPVIFQDVNSLADLQEVPELYRRLFVKGWKYDRHGNFVLDLVDKDVAMDRLARHLSFYRDVMRVEVVDYGELLDHAARVIDGKASHADASAA